MTAPSPTGRRAAAGLLAAPAPAEADDRLIALLVEYREVQAVKRRLHELGRTVAFGSPQYEEQEEAVVANNAREDTCLEAAIDVEPTTTRGLRAKVTLATEALGSVAVYSLDEGDLEVRLVFAALDDVLRITAAA